MIFQQQQNLNVKQFQYNEIMDEITYNCLIEKRLNITKLNRLKTEKFHISVITLHKRKLNQCLQCGCWV